MSGDPLYLMLISSVKEYDQGVIDIGEYQKRSIFFLESQVKRES
jgi:hypothetical protein